MDEWEREAERGRASESSRVTCNAYSANSFRVRDDHDHDRPPDEDDSIEHDDEVWCTVVRYFFSHTASSSSDVTLGPGFTSRASSAAKGSV